MRSRKDRPQGASRGTGKSKGSEVVFWYGEKKGHRTSDCRKKQRDHDKGQSNGSKDSNNNKGKGSKKEFKGKCFKCGKTGDMSTDCRSKETSAFEAGEEGLAETGCIDLNALKIGAVQLPEKDHKICIGIDLSAVVTVFPKTVAGRLPDAPNAGQSKELPGRRQASFLQDLGARMVQVKL